MESKPSAAEAAAALEDAEAAGARFAGRIVTPSGFFVSLAVAIAIQIATTAAGLGQGAVWVLIAGLGVFAAVAGVQLVRFRAANGVWLGGLASRVVLGTATAASLTYVVALGVACWAAFRDAGWLVALCAVCGGAAYALSGRRWLATYRARPDEHARGESALALAVLAVVALAGLVALVVGR